MAGINFLYDEYRKDPKRIEDLLSKEIEISEKLDASSFFVQAHKSDLKFYKKKDIQITSIDRTLSKFYEKAIFHFSSLSEEIIEQMPDDWRFKMDYFPNLQPVTISYDNLPMNHLVLTSIQVRDPRDKIVEIICDKETLFKWADTLEIEKPPIIFEGTLNDSKKTRILDFLNTPYKDLIQRFHTENFTKFILTLLNPELKKSFLNDDFVKDIDGLLFKFDGKEVFRVSNPDVVISKQKKVEEKPSDIYNLTLVLLQEFMVMLDFNKIKLKSVGFEDRYIEFISKCFNKFVKSNYYSSNFNENVDFDLPGFLTRSEFGVNFEFVNDPETMELLKLSNTNRELFKIFLASMRSKKRRSSGFFTKELVKYHNELVDKISDYINGNLKESLVSFEEFKSVFLGENEDWGEYGKDQGDKDFENLDISEDITKRLMDLGSNRQLHENLPSFQETGKLKEYDTFKPVIEVLKKMFSPENEEDVDKDSKEVCVMKGKFFPFHNGHISAIKDAANESKKPVFLIISLQRVAKHVSLELHREMLDQIVKENEDICGYEFSSGKSWKEHIKHIPKRMKVKAYSGSVNECDDVMIQANERIMTIHSTKHTNSKTILQKIKNEDIDSYKKLVPKCLHNFFYKIRSELK